MKSVTLLIIPFLLILSGLSNEMQAQRYFGMRAGVNFANVTKSEDGGEIINDRLTLLDLAGHLSFSVAPEFYLQTEVHFIQRGFRSSGYQDYNYKLNYFNFCPLIQYRFLSSTFRTPAKKKKKVGKISLSCFSGFGSLLWARHFWSKN